MVRTQVGEVNSKVETLSKSVEENQERTRANEGRIGEVDQKAVAAGQRADAAGRRADEARAAADAVNTRADAIEKALLARRRIPLISAELKPWCSIWFKPDMVHPCGVVTLSTSLSGWLPAWTSNDAAPRAVWAAISSASSA